MKKQKFIEDLREGDAISDDIFLLKSARLSETRAGKPYLIVELADRTGEIGGPIWEDAQNIAAICKGEHFIRLTGMVQAYRDKLQLRIESIEVVNRADVNLADFVPCSDYNMDEMAAELQKRIDSLGNGYVRKLLGRFFHRGELWEKFQTAPAAKGIHHAYAGGLLEHCLSMAKLADAMAEHYRGIDRSLLLAGVLLHDIGKLQELSAEEGIVEYTLAGRLKGHIVMGCEMVAEQAAKIKNFPDDLLLQIQHLILSHHGRQEYGSPAVPMTPEAFILSSVDDMDAKMNQFEQLRKKQKDEPWCWSDYQRSLERYLYVTPLGEQEEKVLERPEFKQGTLF